jgi:hypothetical protein
VFDRRLGTRRELSLRFAAGGYAIGLIARNETSFASVEAELVNNGHQGNVRAYFGVFHGDGLVASTRADASDISSVKSAFVALREKLGGDPEVLLYNVGAFQFGQSTQFDVDTCVRRTDRSLIQLVFSTWIRSSYNKH